MSIESLPAFRAATFCPPSVLPATDLPLEGEMPAGEGAIDRHWLLLAAFVLCAVPRLQPPPPRSTTSSAPGWKTTSGRTPRSKGISRQTFDTAFAGVTPNLELPDLVMPGEKAKTPKKQHQAEFGSPGNYFAEKTIGAVTGGGRSRAAKYAKTLAGIEKRYGVPGGVVLAIWGRESGFGVGEDPLRRVRGARHQGVHVDPQGHVPQGGAGRPRDRRARAGDAAMQMKSSWAGALGQPQFLPSSFLEHAVDFDGDGRRDIWNSHADAMASIANYLVHYGWIRGRDWGFEVTRAGRRLLRAGRSGSGPADFGLGGDGHCARQRQAVPGQRGARRRISC